MRYPRSLEDNFPDADVKPIGSPLCTLGRARGMLASVSKDIDGTGGEVITNLFSFTGGIELIELWSYFTDVTDVTTFSGVYFDVSDGANTVDVTADGVDCSGATVGSLIIKDQVNTQAARFLNSSQVRYQKSANFFREWVGGLSVAKTEPQTISGSEWIPMQIQTPPLRSLFHFHAGPEMLN